MSGLRGPEGETPRNQPWSTPRAGGPLARALSQARERQALHRQSGVWEITGDDAAKPASYDEHLARDMAALAREAEARNPAHFVGEPLREEVGRKSHSRSGRSRRGRGLRWTAVAALISAVAGIVVVSSRSREGANEGSPAALRLDPRLSTPGTTAPAKD